MEASVDAKPYPAVFRIIRLIAAPTDPGAVCPDHTPVVPDYNDTIESDIDQDTIVFCYRQVVGA